MQFEGKLQPLGKWAGLGFALILALALRLWCASYSPWFDEWMSTWFAGRPLADLWGSWMVRETNPPLYYTLLKAWTALFGTQVFAMRALSVLGGMASLALLAACAWQAAGRSAGLIAAMLGAVSAQQVFYSTQMRGYIFAELAFALSLLGLLLLFRQDRTDRQQQVAAATYALGAAIAIYCHTTMILWPIAASAAALAMVAFRQLPAKRFVLVLAADVAVVAIAAWWLHVTALQIGGGAKTIAWIPELSLADYLSLLRQTIFLTASNMLPFKLVSYAAVMLALSALAGRDGRTIRFTWALLLASAAVFFLASLFKPIILSRTIFWMSSLVLVLVSATLARLPAGWPRGLAVAMACCLLAIDLAQARGAFLAEDWQGYVRFQATDPLASVLVDGAANGIAAGQACATELAAPCPLRFSAISTNASGATGSDLGGAAVIPLQPGAHPPLAGQVYLLDTAGGSASRHFLLPPGVALRNFAGLKLRGPVPADRLVAR